MMQVTDVRQSSLLGDTLGMATVLFSTAYLVCGGIALLFHLQVVQDFAYEFLIPDVEETRTFRLPSGYHTIRLVEDCPAPEDVVVATPVVSATLLDSSTVVGSWAESANPVCGACPCYVGGFYIDEGGVADITWSAERPLHVRFQGDRVIAGYARMFRLLFGIPAALCAVLAALCIAARRRKFESWE